MNLVGTWRLISFQIESLKKVCSDWGKNAEGLLIYTDSGHMSVSINKNVIKESENEFENILNSTLFYSGTYKVQGHVVHHQVKHASNPDRIGKELIRYAELSGENLTLTTPEESFGRAIIIWRRV